MGVSLVKLVAGPNDECSKEIILHGFHHASRRALSALTLSGRVGVRLAAKLTTRGGMSELKAVAVVCKVRRAAGRERARRPGGGNRVSPSGAAANVDASV